MKSQRKLLIVMLILLAKFTFAQKETKFYWNEKWESVSKKENPSYYSLISLGDNDVPLSDIKTYYITGELYTKYTIIKFDRNDGKNILCQGLKKDFYKNGNLKFEGQYTNEGKVNGLLKFYYENGKTKQIVNYLNGLLHGEVIAYYENGKTKQIENYFNGLAHGDVTSYYENDKIRFTTYYKNGKANGTQIKYYENGNKESIVPIVDDVHNGLVQEFYENGKLKTEANYLNGKYHGKYIEYDENGNKKSEKNYNNGNLEYRTDGIYVFNCRKFLSKNEYYYESRNNELKEQDLSFGFTYLGNNTFEIIYNNSSLLFYPITNEDYSSSKTRLINIFRENKTNLFLKQKFSNNKFSTQQNFNYKASGCAFKITHSFEISDLNVYYNGMVIADCGPYKGIETMQEWSYNGALEFIPLFELSSDGLAVKKKQEEEQAKILKAKQEEEAKKYQLKKEEEAKQAILFEENRKTKLKNLQVGDRVSWSQGWKNTDKFFGFTFSETNYNMNVICYIENVSGDRYQIRVANIKSTSSSNWEYPELNGVPLKEGTLHWIKPSDYINDKSWHYME